MRSVRSLLAIIIIIAAFSISGYSQSAAPSVADIVRSTITARDTYLSEFKNLVSNETRTVAVFSRDGQLKRERSVTSKFVVFALSRDAERVTEFRNVTAVNGKAVSNSDQRVDDFFKSLVKAESSSQELKRIRTESQRYDEELAVSGFTLFQGVTLAPNLIQYFDFALVGQESINGNPVYMIDYRQKGPSPYIKADGSWLPQEGAFGVVYDAAPGLRDSLKERLNGRLWVDMKNYRIWREKRTMTIQPEGFDQPSVIAETEFEYVPSDFGILTPRRIVHTQYRLFRKERETRRDVRATLEYEKFRRPNVEVKVMESPTQ